MAPFCCSTSTSPRVAAEDRLDAIHEPYSSAQCDALSSEAAVREAISLGGLMPAARSNVWPMLLSQLPWEARNDRAVREEYDARAEDLYERLSSSSVRTVKDSLLHTIDADVPRTNMVSEAERPQLKAMLIAHCVHVPAWGYFQGMADVASIALHVTTTSGGTVATAFRLLCGLLSHSEENWAYADLDGVWRQHRAILTILSMVDPPLGRRLQAIDGGRLANHNQPLAFLFGSVFLRLKRECVSLEEVCRLWEVSWASGPHFHILVLTGFVLAQRKVIMSSGTDIASLHQHFNSLQGSQHASLLLHAARALHARIEVRQALGLAMALPNNQASESSTPNRSATQLVAVA